MGEAAEAWMEEMRPALTNWLSRGMLNSDPQVAHAATLVAARLSGLLGKDDRQVKDLAIRTVAHLSERINPADWRSKREAWKTCCAVATNGDPGGSDIYDGLLPGDHGTDRPADDGFM